MKLHLGCGNTYMKGYINVDNLSECPGAKIDKNVDLDIYPWPFRTASIEEVLMSHVIEHLKRPDKALREISRVMKPGGVFRLVVPHYSRGYGVHVHEKGFSSWSLTYDTKDFFEPLSVRLIWDKPENFGKWRLILGPFCNFWNAILNANIGLSERFLIYKFGGIAEIHLVLKRKTK